MVDSLLEYYDPGDGTFIIRGFDPLADAIDYGRELISMVWEDRVQRQKEALAQARKWRDLKHIAPTTFCRARAARPRPATYG